MKSRRRRDPSFPSAASCEICPACLKHVLRQALHSFADRWLACEPACEELAKRSRRSLFVQPFTCAPEGKVFQCSKRTPRLSHRHRRRYRLDRSRVLVARNNAQPKHGGEGGGGGGGEGERGGGEEEERRCGRSRLCCVC